MTKGIRTWAPLAVSLLALFIALGGVSWAQALISGKQIKKNSIPREGQDPCTRGPPAIVVQPTLTLGGLVVKLPLSTDVGRAPLRSKSTSESTPRNRPQ